MYVNKLLLEVGESVSCCTANQICVDLCIGKIANSEKQIADRRRSGSTLTSGAIHFRIEDW